jgi:hypothetical protein
MAASVRARLAATVALSLRMWVLLMFGIGIA